MAVGLDHRCAACGSADFGIVARSTTAMTAECLDCGFPFLLTAATDGAERSTAAVSPPGQLPPAIAPA